MNFSLDSLLEILNPCLPSSSQISRVQRSSRHKQGQKIDNPSALRATWYPSTFRPNHANSYTTPRKCPLIYKNLNRVASWEGIQSIPRASPQSGRESLQNLDSFIVHNALLEEPHLKVLLLRFICDLIRAMSQCVFVSFEIHWHVFPNCLIQQCLGPV